MNAPQRSEAWFQQRLGRVTASRVNDVLAKIKSGEAAARRDYRLQLVCERLTGAPAEDVYVNGDMQRGIDMEPVARTAYEAISGALVEEVGFLTHPDIPMAGASPDGRIGTLGIEIKCPRPATHIAYVQAGTVPQRYIPQIAWQAACAGFEAVDFVSYCEAMPEKLRLLVVRWQRDETIVSAIEDEVRRFLVEVAEDEARLRELAT